jgi:hypothetical protein
MLALAPACVWTLDLDQPIALIPADNLSASDVRDLANAADCWNTEFGTRIVLGGDSDTGQVVHVEFNDFACLVGQGAAGHFHARPQGEIDLCRLENLGPVGLGSELQFAILLHELGHVVNIFGHGSDPDSITLTASPASFAQSSGRPVFTAEDHDLFVEANPDFAIEPACPFPVEFVFADGAMQCSRCP